MHHLKALFFKEMKGEQDTLVGFTVIAMALIIIFVLLTIWQPPGSAANVATLPLALLQLWFIAAGFYFISKEWREQTIALLGGMPVKSWSILAAKMLAAWANFLYLALLFGLGALLVSHVDIPAATAEGGLGLILLKWALSSFLLLAPLVPIAFAVYLSGVTLSTLANLVRILAGAVAAAALCTGYLALELFLSGYSFVLTMPAVVEFYKNEVLMPVQVTPIEIPIPMALVFSIYIVGALSFYAGTRLLDKNFLP